MSRMSLPGTPEERVCRVMNLMNEGKWEAGKTEKELMAEWGCSIQTMRSHAAEASRRQRWALGPDREILRARALEVLQRAEAAADECEDPSDRARALVSVAAAILKTVGSDQKEQQMDDRRTLQQVTPKTFTVLPHAAPHVERPRQLEERLPGPAQHAQHMDETRNEEPVEQQEGGGPSPW